MIGKSARRSLGRTGAGLGLAVALALIGQARAGTECTQETPDASGQIVVRAHEPDVLPLCFAFTPEAGKQATIALSQDDGMIFGLEMIDADGKEHLLGDNHHSTDFVTEAETYHVLAGPAAAHGDATHEFVLTIKVK